MAKIEVTDLQVKGYRDLIKRGATDEDLIGFIDQDTLDVIKSRVKEQDDLKTIRKEDMKWQM